MMLTILTPEDACLFEARVERVRLATDLGELEILPGHASLAATSRATPIVCEIDGVLSTEFLVQQAVIRVEGEDTHVVVAAQVALRRSEQQQLSIDAYRTSLLQALDRRTELSSYQVKHLEDSLTACEQLAVRATS